MAYVEEIFGVGNELTSLQMCCRGIIIFIIALILIRISGRRSFGQSTPLDNIINILFGAILSRAVTGASSFFPVVFTCLIMATLHRFFLWIIVRNKNLRGLSEGNKILLFENGVFNEHNLNRALVSKEDIMQELRSSAHTEELEKIRKIYMERDGKISVVKKEPGPENK